jgi:hypothetical protein
LAPTPPPTPFPPAPPVVARGCPVGYEKSSRSLKGVSGRFSDATSYPAGCAAICEELGCTSFAAGTTTEYCFHPGSASSHCSGCWTYMHGKADLDKELQEASLTTCIKKATQPCARPASFCTGPGDTYADTVDCDKDGINDPQCFNLGAGHKGFVASGSWCTNTWPAGGCAIPPSQIPAWKWSTLTPSSQNATEPA